MTIRPRCLVADTTQKQPGAENRATGRTAHLNDVTQQYHSTAKQAPAPYRPSVEVIADWIEFYQATYPGRLPSYRWLAEKTRLSEMTCRRRLTQIRENEKTCSL